MNADSEKPIVLIVDDTPSNLDVLIDTLSSSGVKVSIAMNGEEALNLVEQIFPDLILLDVLMPGIDGFETCRRLKELEAARDIPVLFMTALSASEDKVKGFQAGGVDYITKPFQHEEVQARIAAHLTIRQQQRQLKNLNASKDKFFSIIAHDLRSPLTSFLSFVEILEHADNFDPGQFKQYTGQFRQSAENLSALLENLLTWSRMQHGMIEYQPQTLDMYALAVTAVSIVAPNAQHKQICVQQNIPKDFRAYGDLNMVDTVLRNLLSNAIKFTPPEGTITLSSVSEGDMVTLAVSDTGIGIPDDKIELLFKIHAKYQRRGTAGEKGTGLGLVLCKEFIEKNGGRIWAEGRKEQGTVFKFSLPAGP